MEAKVFFTRVEIEEAPKSQIVSPRSSPENNASAQAKEQKTQRSVLQRLHRSPPHGPQGPHHS
jgi:hypothetical protein